MLKMLNGYAQGKAIQKHNKKGDINQEKTAVTLFVFNHLLQS